MGLSHEQRIAEIKAKFNYFSPVEQCMIAEDIVHKIMSADEELNRLSYLLDKDIHTQEDKVEARRLHEILRERWQQNKSFLITLDWDMRTSGLAFDEGTKTK